MFSKPPLYTLRCWILFRVSLCNLRLHRFSRMPLQTLRCSTLYVLQNCDYMPSGAGCSLDSLCIMCIILYSILSAASCSLDFPYDPQVQNVLQTIPFYPQVQDEPRLEFHIGNYSYTAVQYAKPLVSVYVQYYRVKYTLYRTVRTARYRFPRRDSVEFLQYILRHVLHCRINKKNGSIQSSGPNTVVLQVSPNRGCTLYVHCTMFQLKIIPLLLAPNKFSDKLWQKMCTLYNVYLSYFFLSSSSDQLLSFTKNPVRVYMYWQII